MLATATASAAAISDFFAVDGRKKARTGAAAECELESAVARFAIFSRYAWYRTESATNASPLFQSRRRPPFVVAAFSRYL